MTSFIEFIIVPINTTISNFKDEKIFTENIIDSCVFGKRWMKYPIFALLCSEFAKIELQTIVGCLKFISCENWALWIVNFVKPAEMLKTLSGNSGISDMDSFCFVYNLKYSKLCILYISQIYIFHKDLETIY